jgi:hypothetical protein
MADDIRPPASDQPRPFVGEPFRHDIFVSYSHGDFDGSDHSPLKVWSVDFVQYLEQQIRQIRHFREVRMFLDQDHRPGQGVDPTEPLTEQLSVDIEGSALLVILMTPDYLASNWCGQERDWWLEQHHPDTIGAGGRIFVCRIWPNTKELPWNKGRDHEAWPDALKDSGGDGLPGFWFHSCDNVDDATVPFRWGGVTHDLNEYVQACRELIRAITSRLREIKRRLDERRREEEDRQRLAGAGGKIIYLHAREAQATAWQEARDALRRSGYVVYPSAPEADLLGDELPDARANRAARNQRILQLEECDAILLLSTGPSVELDIDLAAIGRKDRETARERSGKLLPCAVLDTAGQTIEAADSLAIEHLDGRTTGWEMAIARWLERCASVSERVAA